MNTTKNYSERNFSNKFDNYTLNDIVRIKTPKQLAEEERQRLLKEWLDLEKFRKRLTSDPELDDIFHLLPPIKPDRYMWHLTRESCRDSISKFGLERRLCGDKPLCGDNGIWAHNNIIHINQFYPMTWDGIYSNANYRDFDFWRIDTKLCNSNWKMDPYMTPLKLNYKTNEWRYAIKYLVTKDSIPPEALKLYQFPQDGYYDDENSFDYTIFDLIPRK